MSILFIDGFDNYSGLSDKWNKIYRGVSIAQGVGKRNTNCLQVGSSYYNDNHYLSYSIEDTDSIVIGFAYKKNTLKTIGTENIALNKLTGAESVYGQNYVPSFAVDGDRSSQWSGNSAGVTYWIVVDLERVSNICGFGLECWYGGTYSWEYYGSNNNTNWNLIVSESAQEFNGNLITTISGIDVNYRYVMADVTPVGGITVRVTDFQVYEYVNVSEGPTTSISFVTSGTEQCIINLGAEDIIFYSELSSPYFEDRGIWGENSYCEHTEVTEDCFLYKQSPNNNYNTDNLSLGCGGGALRINRPQIKFDLSYLQNLKNSIYPSLAITNAMLSLRTYSTIGDHNVSAYRCLKDWDEQLATWNKFRTGGTYEIPTNIYTTGVIRWAGVAETYTTIAAAVSAANDGDIIALMDVSYAEIVNINKWVHVVGVHEATGYADNLTYIRTTAHDTRHFAYSMPTDCPFPDPYDKTIIVERIWVSCGGNRLSAFGRNTNVSGTVLANKCRFEGESAYTYSIQGTDGHTRHDSQFYNCDLRHTEYLALDVQGTWGLTKCYINALWFTAYNIFNSTTESPSDYVLTTTSGYGPSYGDLLIPFDLDVYWNSPGCSAVASGTISGTLEDGIYDRMKYPESTVFAGNGYAGQLWLDLTDLSDKWLDGTASQYGVHLRSDNENISNYMYLYSSSSTNLAYRPMLNVSYETSFSGTTVSGCMVSGTWNYVEAKINFDDTNGSVDLRVDESNVLNLSNISTTSSGLNAVDSIRIYSRDGQKSDSMESVYSYIDDLYVCNTSGSINNDLLGVCLVDVAFPSASGTNNDYDIRYYYDDKRYEVIDGPSNIHGIYFEETVQLTDGDDDGFFNYSNPFSTITNNILLEGYITINGYEGKAFFRFNNINIPKNAVIEEAILKLTPYESSFVNNIYMHGRFELSGGPTTRPTSQVDLESRELTSDATKATWDGQKLITFSETNSMHNSLQELVDMDDWQEEDNAVTVVIDFGGYALAGATAYVNVRNHNWVYNQGNPNDYLDVLPMLYLKWRVDTVYDMSEYVYSSSIGHKDTYYHEITVSGVTLSGIDDIYAVQHNLISKYIINNEAVSELGCKPMFLISGTEYFGDKVDYAATTSGFYLGEYTIFEQNPETHFAWSGKDIADMEAGSTII